MEYTRPTIRKIKEQPVEGNCAIGSVANQTRCVRGAGGFNVPRNCVNGKVASNAGAPNCGAGGVP